MLKSDVTLDRTVAQIVERIVRAIRPDKVFLFGSRLTDSPEPESDIDLLVLYGGDRTPQEIQIEIHRLFERPGFSLDVFALKTEDFEAQKKVANTLAREVSERGLVCYG